MLESSCERLTVDSPDSLRGLLVSFLNVITPKAFEIGAFFLSTHFTRRALPSADLVDRRESYKQRNSFVRRSFSLLRRCNERHPFFRYQSCTIFKTHYPRATIRNAGLFARALLLLIILLAPEWKYIIISCSAGRRRGVVYVTAEDMARRECAYASTTVKQHVRTIGTRKNHLPNGRNWQMFIRVIHFTIVAACTCVYA